MAASSRVVLITGTSSGIGQVCARYLDQRGHRVYGTSRRGASGASGSDRFATLAMDVDDDASVRRCVTELLDREQRIDVVVNNAGFSLAGAIEDVSIDEARAQMETNFFGVLRVCQAVLPTMRAQRAGYIINISSIGGQVGLPFFGLYSASKFAVEGLTEALRAEVWRFGIRPVLIEPGNFATSIADNRRVAAQSAGEVYRGPFQTALASMQTNETQGASPDAVAHLVERIIDMPWPRPRYTVGPMLERSAVPLKRLLPSRVFERALWKVVKAD